MSIRSAFVLAVPAVLLAGVGVAAGAHASSSAPQPVSLTAAVAPIAAGASPTAGAGAAATTDVTWPKLCARVDTVLPRVGAVSTRLHAGAETKGSLARLQARLDAATKAGDADRVRVLSDLLAIRQSHVQTVTVKVEKLTDVQQVCKAHSG